MTGYRKIRDESRQFNELTHEAWALLIFITSAELDAYRHEIHSKNRKCIARILKSVA